MKTYITVWVEVKKRKKIRSLSLSLSSGKSNSLFFSTIDHILSWVNNIEGKKASGIFHRKTIEAFCIWRLEIVRWNQNLTFASRVWCKKQWNDCHLLTHANCLSSSIELINEQIYERENEFKYRICFCLEMEARREGGKEICQSVFALIGY